MAGRQRAYNSGMEGSSRREPSLVQWCARVAGTPDHLCFAVLGPSSASEYPLGNTSHPSLGHPSFAMALWNRDLGLSSFVVLASCWDPPRCLQAPFYTRPLRSSWGSGLRIAQGRRSRGLATLHWERGKDPQYTRTAHAQSATPLGRPPSLPQTDAS